MLKRSANATQSATMGSGRRSLRSVKTVYKSWWETPRCKMYSGGTPQPSRSRTRTLALLSSSSDNFGSCVSAIHELRSEASSSSLTASCEESSRVVGPVSFDRALVDSAGGGVGGREDAMSESESVCVLWLEDELLLTPRPAFSSSIFTSPCLSFF